MVNSQKIETASLIEAMETGDFYSSSGVPIKKKSITARKSFLSKLLTKKRGLCTKLFLWVIVKAVII